MPRVFNGGYFTSGATHMGDCSSRWSLTALLTYLFFLLVWESSTVDATPLDNDTTIEARVNAILKDTPLIDGHNDLAWHLRWANNFYINLDNFTTPWEQGTMLGNVDLLRLRKGKVGGTFWALYTDCPLTGGYTPEYYANALATIDGAIDVLHRLHDKYPNDFGRPLNSSDAYDVFNAGRIISPLGLEGSHLIGDSFAKLRDYHARGTRYVTLTHNCHNTYADSAMQDTPNGTVPATPKWGGVSEAGKKLVYEMNRLGILVDLSHTSADTQRNVLGAPSIDAPPGLRDDSEPLWEGSLAPPIFSHSSSFALCPHPRNVPDDVLQLIKARDGVVMINFWQDFISCRWPNGVPTPGKVPEGYPPNRTVTQVVRHIQHIGDLIGYQHVGLGADFDGVPNGLPGIEDVSKFPNLVAEMLRQGISDADVRDVVGGNVLRVWKEVDRVAERLQKSGALPAEDILPWLPPPW